MSAVLSVGRVIDVGMPASWTMKDTMLPRWAVEAASKLEEKVKALAAKVVALTIERDQKDSKRLCLLDAFEDIRSILTRKDLPGKELCDGVPALSLLVDEANEIADIVDTAIEEHGEDKAEKGNHV